MQGKIDYLKSVGVDIDTAVNNMGDISMYDEMIGDYYDTIDEEMQKIDSAKNSNDISNYTILVHAMKSNSRSFGFMEFGEECYRHEMAGKSNDLNYINENYNKLVSMSLEVKKIIETYKSL